MIGKVFTTKILLPAWLFEQAKDKDHFKRLLDAYMTRYPDYVVKAVNESFAICERRE